MRKRVSIRLKKYANELIMKSNKPDISFKQVYRFLKKEYKDNKLIEHKIRKI